MNRLSAVVLMASIVTSALPSDRVYATVLIAADEAKLPPRPAEKSRGVRPRVTIEQLSPQSDAGVKSPVHLIIKFIPHNQTKVDLSSLKVLYLKQPLVDLTNRVAPYASAAGIDMPDAEMPAGTHSIQLRFADSEGTWTAGTIALTVLP